MGRKKKYIEMFRSFTELFNYKHVCKHACTLLLLLLVHKTFTNMLGPLRL